MKRKIFTMIATSLLLVLILSSCATTPTSDMTQVWWFAWIEQPACSPPCWEHIIPGETSITEAKGILDKIPNVEITYNSDYGLTWIFTNTAQVGSGDIKTSPDGIVNSLSIGNALELELTLIQIIEKYDEPALVSPYYCREGLCDAIILYPEFGMALRIFTEDIGEGDQHIVSIKPDTVVKYVVFFSINGKDEKLGGYVNEEEFESFVPWRGYGIYP